MNNASTCRLICASLIWMTSQLGASVLMSYGRLDSGEGDGEMVKNVIAIVKGEMR